jgi:Xaa-Pro dipeptidase
MTEQLPRLRQALAAAHLDALAVVPGANLRYLAGIGFTTKLRLTMALFTASGPAALVVPRMEQARAAAESRVPFQVYPWDDGEQPTDALRRAAADLSLAGRIGVENTVMRVFELRALEAAVPGAEMVDATPLLAAMRAAKDARELAAIRQAVRIIEATLRETLGRMCAGMTEREVAAIWNNAITAAGCVPAFETTVGSGPNGANPHHTNSDRRLQPGDLVVLDGGVCYDGYASDITRTVAVGEPGEEARRIYALVQQANAAGRAAAALPGATGDAIDRAARAVIEAGGYGPYFFHRTGHGIGLEIHEPPFIVTGATEPLPVGATFTIEPGIYLAGFGGVRIEDDVVIAPDGAESLTTFERELIVIADGR